MKLHVLVDNNTLIDRYFLAEPGVSYYIEDGGKKILFDAGYSDVFIKNAQKMQIDLLDLDYVVLSHGHIDHSWGLMPLIQLHQEAVIEQHTRKRPAFIAHPDALLHKSIDEEAIGSLVSESQLGKHFDLGLSKEPVWLTDKLVFLGEIKRENAFEGSVQIGTVEKGTEVCPDYVNDDSALAYKTEAGIVVITGCSHAGICNIIEQAKRICDDTRVIDVIGGFHLLSPSKALLENTTDYLKQGGVEKLHACHCTDLNSKIALSKVAALEEVGSGLVIEYI